MKELLLSLVLAASAATPGVQDALIGPLDPGTTVVIEAPYYAWGIRPVSAEIDRKLEGLVVRNRRGIQCEDFPEARCVTVLVEQINPDYGGLFNGDQIIFNSMYGATNRHWRRSVACHEFLHLLGFTHHSDRGCVSEGVADWERPSLVEYEVLFDHYGESQ